MDTEVLRARPKELIEKLVGIREYASQHKLSITQVMENEDPTHEYPANERFGLDAFGRVLREMGIRTRSIPELGIQASTVGEFGKSLDTAIAFSEWLERRKREAQIDRRQLAQNRAVYSGMDQPPGTTINQISFDTQPYFTQIAPAVPITEVVAKTTNIVGSTYEAYFLTDNTGQKRMVRIPEGTEVPAVKLTGSNHVIRVRKFGRRLDATYESLRRISIDLLALHIARMMVQSEVDKLAAIIDVIVNGDQSGGNGATVYNMTTLDPSISSPDPTKLTLRAYLTFKAKFRNPYIVTTMLGQENVVVQTQLLNTGSANIPLLFLQNLGGQPYGNTIPINPELADSVRIGLTDDAPSSKLVALDSRFAIERIVELGSDITESARWVQKQVESLVMTFDEGYAVIDQNAIKIMDMAN